MLRTNPVVDPIRNRILRLLPADVLARVQERLETISLRQGEIIYDPGDQIDRLHFPSDGIISLITIMPDGTQVEAGFVGRREALGLPAWWEGRVALQRAVVQVPGYAHCIDASDLRLAIQDSPEANDLFIRCTDLALSQATQSVACIALHSAEERLARWLLMCCDRCEGVVFPLTQEFLAAMLCVQRTTVTLAAQALQRAGAIQYRRGRLEVIDRARLSQLTCGCYAQERLRSTSILPSLLDSDDEDVALSAPTR